MTRGVWSGVGAVGLVCWIAAAALAADPAKVLEVRLENRGPGHVDEAFVRNRISTAAGRPFDRSTVSRDVRSLLNSGWFTDVKAEALPSSNDVVVVFSLVNRWRLAGPVEFVGRDEFSVRKLRKLVELEPGDPVDEQVLGAKATKVRDEYRKYDYYQATVRPELVPVDRTGGTARATLYIEEGTEVPVKHVAFNGNQVAARRDLLDAIQYPNWWNPFRYFRSFDHETDDLALYRAEVRDVYLNRGYLDVAVSQPRVMTNDAGRASLHIAVAEGDLYRLRSWSVSGSVLFTAEELLKAVKLKPGAVASMKSIDAAAQAIKDRYSARGYLGTVVRPRVDPDRASLTVDIEFTVKEGTLTHLRLVQIVGNDRTRDKVVRRELVVYPGDLYDEAKIERSRRRLQNLGYFSRVEAFPQDTTARDEKDLVVEVEEKSTGQFMIGAGFSSVDNLLGFMELSQGNFDIKGWPYFTGGGQKLKLRAEVGSSRSSYDLSFIEPWFLDRQLSLGFDLFRTQVDYDDYEQTTTGFATTLGKSLGGGNRLDLRYQLKRDEISDVSDTNLYTVVETGEQVSFVNEQDTVDSSVRATLGHDSRNHPFLPTAGTRASVFSQVSGGALGFDEDLVRSGFQARQYWSPWMRHTITFRCRYETVDSYGDTEEVDLANRLFVGGGRSLRGFENRDVGPKAIRTDAEGNLIDYKPIGGQSMAFATVEYAIPVVRGVRLAAFYDTGNAWLDPYEADASGLASSWGLGFRFDIPNFPIRIDRAWVIEYDDEYTNDDPWVFWIGYDF